MFGEASQHTRMATDEFSGWVGFDENNELQMTGRQPTIQDHLEMAQRSNDMMRDQITRLETKNEDLQRRLREKDLVIQNLILRYETGELNRSSATVEEQDRIFDLKSTALVEQTMLENAKLRENVAGLNEQMQRQFSETQQLRQKYDELASNSSMSTVVSRDTTMISGPNSSLVIDDEPKRPSMSVPQTQRRKRSMSVSNGDWIQSQYDNAYDTDDEESDAVRKKPQKTRRNSMMTDRELTQLENRARPEIASTVAGLFSKKNKRSKNTSMGGRNKGDRVRDLFSTPQHEHNPSQGTNFFSRSMNKKQRDPSLGISPIDTSKKERKNRRGSSSNLQSLFDRVRHTPSSKPSPAFSEANQETTSNVFPPPAALKAELDRAIESKMILIERAAEEINRLKMIILKLMAELGKDSLETANTVWL